MPTMSNPETPASSGEPTASQLLAEARQALSELKKLRAQAETSLKDGEAASKKAAGESQNFVEQLKNIKAQAEEHLKEAEAARKKADGEGLLAFNAKEACEKHATTIAGIKGTVEADAKALATNKQTSEEVLAALTSGKATVDTDIKIIDDRRKEVDQSAINIVKAAEIGAARLQEIETSKDSAQAALKITDESSKAATQAASSTDAAQKRAEKSSTDAAAFTATISENLKATNQHVIEAQALLTQSQTAEAALKKVLEHLAKSDEISSGHEQHVENLKLELQSLIERIEGLLPGAASAGLASSFHKQKSRFERPQQLSLWAFVACIVVLVVLAIPSFLSAVGVSWFSHPSDQTWNGAWRNFILRLPIVLPVVWLAIYAGRNYMLSLRMEEDYAYKEAISSAFEGYKREMEKITAVDGANPTPLTILCTNILRAISERPGRIYEGKQEDITLLAELQKSADFSKKKLATE
jgi:hypothetical protein